MSWHEIPFVRLLIPLILGITLQDYIQMSWSPVVIAGVLLFIIFSLIFLARPKRAFSQRLIFGGALFMGMIFVGSFLYSLHDEHHFPDHYHDNLGVEVDHWLDGDVVWLKRSEKYTKVILNVKHEYEGSGRVDPCSGNLLAYIPLDARSMGIKLGQRLKVKKKIAAISENQNPKAFDFKRYWHLKNIHFQSFLHSDDWELQEHKASFSFSNQALLFRDQLLLILREYLPAPNEFGVGASLILGEKSDLSGDVKLAFAQTGSMHVLAVSGLHTGLVFLAVNFILGLFTIKNRWWPWLKASVLLLAIWSFAFLTGASSSVLRAASMFSFVIVGTALNRSSIIYNTLAASAFCLLMIEPKMLFEPGFQLSYLAVLGIVYFQPKVYKAWYIQNKIGDYAWKLTSVSIAAQIVTLPLSLYYFHQFPLYFWLSGLVVIPAAIVILPLGFISFLFHPIPWLGVWVGKLLYAIVWLLNAIIFQINSLPFGLVKGIWIGGSVVLLLYLMVVFIIGFLETKIAKWLIFALIGLNVVLLLNVLQDWKSLQQHDVIVYHIPGTSLIDFVDGENRYSLTSNELSRKKEGYAAGNNRTFLRTIDRGHFLLSDTLISSENFFKTNDLLQFRDKQLVVLRKQSKMPFQKIKILYILVTQNAIPSINQLQRYYDFETVVFDGSNSRKKVKKWQEEIEALGLRSYYTGDKGAFVLK